MPIFSDEEPKPYPPDTTFCPTPTYEGADVPNYGFYFSVPKGTVSQYPFDNCQNYNSFLFKDDVEKKLYLLMRYELLYEIMAEHRLAYEYYPVPWVLVPSGFSSAITIKLMVGPYSIYDGQPGKKLRKSINDDLNNNNRPIELSVPNASSITAYWYGSGTDTTIEEKELTRKDGQPIRILIAAPTQSAPYVPGTDIERKQEVLIKTGSTVLGKLRITFCKPLSQDVCFVKVTQSVEGGPFTAKILLPSEIPDSFEDQTPPLDQALAQTLKPYCIDIISAKNAKLLDADGNEVLSTTTTLQFDAGLKPPALTAAGEPTPKRHIDQTFTDALYSKLKTYKCIQTSGEVEKAIQKLIIIVILPFYLDQAGEETTAGFTPIPPNFDGGYAKYPVRSYVLPIGTKKHDDTVANVAKLWPAPENDPSKVTVSPVSNPYLAYAVVHEVLHALQLAHTFPDVKDGASQEVTDAFTAQYLSSYAQNMANQELTPFGDRKSGVTPAGGNIFELMRDSDLNSAVVDQYLWGVRQLSSFDPQTPQNPALATGWIVMRQMTENVLFVKYKTYDFMDYSNDIITLSSLKDISGNIAASFTAKWTQTCLYRYQWELARVSVQYLSTYTP